MMSVIVPVFLIVFCLFGYAAAKDEHKNGTVTIGQLKNLSSNSYHLAATSQKDLIKNDNSVYKILKPQGPKKKSQNKKRKNNKKLKLKPSNLKITTNKPKKQRNERKGKRKRRKFLTNTATTTNSNILEITTARSKNQVLLQDINSTTLNNLIEKINANPERSYENLFSEYINSSSKNAIIGETHKLIGSDNTTDVTMKTNFDMLEFATTEELPKLDLTTGYRLFRPNMATCRKYFGCSQFCNAILPKKCYCFRGFTLDTDGKTCIDINECQQKTSKCQANCYNTIGSFYCSCQEGYRLSFDGRSCEDINECLLRNGHGPCQDRCTNFAGSYKCDCSGLKGTKLAKDGRDCVDVDHCADAGCSHSCVNTHSGPFCTCPRGMELGEDYKTCHDINKCQNIHRKRCPHGCINTIGSYYCPKRPQQQSDQSRIYSRTCPPLLPPQTVGYFKCFRNVSSGSPPTTKSGRFRVTNRPGTKCILICPEGFKKHGGQYKVTCNKSGDWIGNKSGECLRMQ